MKNQFYFFADAINENIGDTAHLLFNVNFTNRVHVISIRKNSDSIGSYDPNNGAFVSSKYRKRYDIVVEQEVGLRLQIKEIQAEDEALFTVTVTYESIPEVILQRYLKVKGNGCYLFVYSRVVSITVSCFCFEKSLI